MLSLTNGASWVCEGASATRWVAIYCLDMRVFMGVLVALVGAVAGAAIGVGLTYALLSGEGGVDAFSWLAAGLFFCFFCIPIGAVAAGLLGGNGFGASVAYGIGASLVVMVVGPLAAVYYPTGGTSRSSSPPAGKLCGQPGIRYVGGTTGVRVCFTLTPDLGKRVEIGWRFGRASGCPAGRDQRFWEPVYDGYELALDSPGQITEPDFTATIRGARASGVLGRFRWSARRAS